MGLSVLKMYCKKGNTTYPVDLYTSSQETGMQTNLCKKIVTGTQSEFFRLSTYLQNGAAGGDTPMRVKLNNNVYKVTQHGEFKITITPSENQTITCTANGITWTSGTKWFPYGTKWTAKVEGISGYNPGTLSATSGTLINNDVTLSATPATLAELRFEPYPSGFYPNGSRETSWVCPDGITRIELDGNRNKPHYIDVVPGREYKISVSEGDHWYMCYYTGETWKEKVGKRTYIRKEQEYIGDDYLDARLYIRTGGDLIIRYNVKTTQKSQWLLYTNHN
jgi:hypothetical protein|uniref:Uncharacterized protein n=1 Tax=Podoviridae sp. ctHMt20 TaxID=2827728 RepID=A0A8S5SL66_9CAUD|nr:MAG TPA: hypothetical protein [Podoviridae sp. ctHMt20]